MKRIYLAIALGVFGLACTKDDGRATTTMVTSGTTTSGIRVTNVPTERDPAERLAGELCRHDTICNLAPRSGTDEARLLSEQACVTERTADARRFLSGWKCTPAAGRARLEECLAAIRGERCETVLDDPARLGLCPRNLTCAEDTVTSER
jgi:hypothetical protein